MAANTEIIFTNNNPVGVNMTLYNMTAVGQGQWGLNNKGNNYIWKRGMVCTLRLQFTPNKNISANTIIAAIPTGFRPYCELGFMIHSNNSSEKAMISVSQDGIYTYTALVSGVQYHMTCTYII